MKKIPTLYVRDPEDRRYVTDQVTPGCEWVLAGEGVATRKYDGTCVMLDDSGKWWARREVKPGKQAPLNFQAVDYDEETGKTVGWEPIEQSPFAKFHAEAVERGDLLPYYQPGTYELCGPKINGNPERVNVHTLIRHADAERVDGLLLSRPGLVQCLRVLRDTEGWEGIVWHHPDGRMAKLKAKDFPQIEVTE